MSPSKVFTEVVRDWSEVFMHRSGRDFRRFMHETGLSFSQVNLLMRLYHVDKSGVSKIGKRLGVTSAAASQAIDRLVILGLVERTEDPSDRRAKQLVLTPKGRELITHGIEMRCEWVEGLTNAFTKEQQGMIITALTLLTEAAQKSEE